MHKFIKKLTNIILLIILFNSFIFLSNIQAKNIINTQLNINNKKEIKMMYQRLESPELGGRLYYIKNMLTGQYLDVQGGNASNGTNVWQYKYNGTKAQQWYLNHNEDGTYTIFSQVGSENGYIYALDISNGSSDNCANVQIWYNNNTDAQRFNIVRTTEETYVLYTKCSNYQKAVVLNGPTCEEGRNVDQYTFQGHINEAWILEPANRNIDLGIRYAETNYNKQTFAYPYLINFNGHTANCANFVSQCMLASGIHYDNDWKVYRKNFNYDVPSNVNELNDTWELCQPKTSPWISAKKFGEYWIKKVNIKKFDVNYILNHPTEIYAQNFYKGDVVQIAQNNLGFLGASEHTMFITRYGKYNGIMNFELTYSSNPTINKNLIQICQEYRNKGQNPYIVFFRM